jgi:zinc protease
MVAAITRDDLVAFHARHYHPDRVILGVSGLFDEAELLALVRRHFGDWAPAGAPPAPFPLPDAPPRARVLLAAKDLPQATIVMGHLAPARESADFHAFTVLDHILGGSGFGSRLTSEIRSDRGLAYSVGSFYRADAGYGVFGAYCKTKTESAAEATGLMRAIMERLRREGPGEEELRRAKDAIVNNLIFSVDGSREVVAQKMAYRYDGLPEDFLERYRDRIEAVTAAEVREAARRHLRPDAAATVIVGDESGAGMLPAELGPVERIALRKY